MVKHHSVVGRYVTIEVDDCEYKVFYLQNGKGIPLICQHTAGCHNPVSYTHLTLPTISSV